MRQLRLREVKCPAQCHPGNKWKGWNLIPLLCEGTALCCRWLPLCVPRIHVFFPVSTAQFGSWLAPSCVAGEASPRSPCLSLSTSILIQPPQPSLLLITSCSDGSFPWHRYVKSFPGSSHPLPFKYSAFSKPKQPTIPLTSQPLPPLLLPSFA